MMQSQKSAAVPKQSVSFDSQETLILEGASYIHVESDSDDDQLWQAVMATESKYGQCPSPSSAPIFGGPSRGVCRNLRKSSGGRISAISASSESIDSWVYEPTDSLQQSSADSKPTDSLKRSGACSDFSNMLEPVPKRAKMEEFKAQKFEEFTRGYFAPPVQQSPGFASSSSSSGSSSRPFKQFMQSVQRRRVSEQEK